MACKDTLVEPIEVYPKPTINTVTETDICWPNAVAYDNNSSISSNWNGSTLVSFDWDYGDGNTGTGTTSSHAFALPNQYAETLVVTTNVGCKDTLSGTVDVWPKPDINSISDLDICWPQAASFSNVSTVPNNWNMASIVDFDWHFGDGTTGLGGSTTHAYSIPNLYNDSLIVITSDMCRDTFAETISIWPKPAIDSVTVLDQCWPNGTNFQGYHSIANNWNSAAVTIYDWDFGDANSGNTNPIFHVYTLPNVYTHELIVETGNACRDTLVDQVNIWPKPSINSITEIDICWPNAVDFSNNTTIPVNWNMATIAQWDWRFGDGNTGNTPTLQHNYLIPNRYSDTLYVRTTDEYRDTLTGSVDVWPKPSIDSILVQDVCEPEIVNFSVAAQILNNWDNATFSQYLWNFGDGNTATGASTTHQYATAGAYLVTLIVVTSDACSDTLTKTVNVYPKPSSNYTIADICYGDSLFLNSTSSVSNVLGTFIANHFWTFGDGDSSQVVNPAHFYNFDGLYTVTLVTTTNHNCKDTLIQPVNVYPKPNASFTFPRTCQPDAVAFADASTLSSGTISNYDWDFGDGGSSTMQNPSYAYAAADSYFVELIVTTDQGCLDTLLKALVWNPKPSADFDFQNICFPDSMYFNDLTTLQFGNLLRWEWDFGDGNSSLATNPVHAYTTAGSYSVQLIVTTDSLCMDTLVQTVYSNEKPQAAYSPSTICWPDTVPFQDQSTIGGTAQVVGWSWQFGDGDTSSLQNPMHYYAHPDTFNLTFIAFSDSGCTDTLANRFVAFPPPGLQIGPDTLWLCPFNTVDLHAGPQFVNYTWQDGSTDSLFIVNTPGVYWVTVTDTNGCMQSDTVETPLAPKPVLNVDPGDSVAFCTGSSIVVDAVTPTIQSFQWSTGATSSEIEIDQAGTYTVIGWNEYVCSDTVDVVVVENPLPIPDLGPDLSICAGDTSLLNPGTFQSYAWSNGAVDQEIKVWYSGVFAVTVTDNNLCEAADTIQVVRHELPQVNLGPDSSLCAGDAMIFDAGAGFVSYFWSPSGEVSQSITVDSQDSVSVIVTDVFGCVNISNVVWVSVDPLPAVPTITKGDDEIELVSSVEANYQWLLGGNNLSGSILQFHIPTESGDYQVIVTDTNGCSMISEIFFISLDIFDEEMFQGISPNGDGVNDRFTVPEIEYYPENTIQIFNRWGTIVFDKKGYLNEFVGRDGKGNELPDGTYFYVLDLGNGQKPVKGYFVINR